MAHSRRRRENDTFSDMAEVLPIQENAKDLDKASILRVAINYLKLRELIGENDGEEGADTEAEAGNEERGDLTTQIKKEDPDFDGSPGTYTLVRFYVRDKLAGAVVRANVASVALQSFLLHSYTFILLFRSC